MNMNIEGFEMNHDLNIVAGLPFDRFTQVGDFTFCVESSVNTADGPVTVSSQPITVSITDPCPYTII